MSNNITTGVTVNAKLQDTIILQSNPSHPENLENPSHEFDLTAEP